MRGGACVCWVGGVSILMDDIIPHIRHYFILQSSQHDSHHTVSGIPLHPSFLSSFSFFPSIPPPPRVGTACFCRQCCLLLASLLLLRHAIGDCFLLAPWRGPIRMGQTALITEQNALQGTAWANQNGWFARHPEVKGEGRGRFQPMKRLLPQQPGISGYRQTRQGVNTITHTHTH